LKFKIKNWEKFQQFKDGRPMHWIKLHTCLLDDYHMEMLSEKDQLTLIKIWLLVARTNPHNDGVFEFDEDFIARKTGIKSPNLDNLEKSGFLTYLDKEQSRVREDAVRKNKLSVRKNTEELPAELNKNAWNDYLQHRKDIKAKALKPQSESRLIRWLISQGDHEHQQEIIDATIRNGWIGLFEHKKEKRGGQSTTGTALDNIFNAAATHAVPVCEADRHVWQHLGVTVEGRTDGEADDGGMDRSIIEFH